MKKQNTVYVILIVAAVIVVYLMGNIGTQSIVPCSVTFRSSEDIAAFNLPKYIAIDIDHDGTLEPFYYANQQTSLDGVLLLRSSQNHLNKDWYYDAGSSYKYDKIIVLSQSKYLIYKNYPSVAVIETSTTPTEPYTSLGLETNSPVGCGIVPPEPTCGDNICNGVETSSNCPGDCPVTNPCDYDHTCESGETQTNCPSDCGTSPPNPCDNDNTCEAGETVANCPGDCEEVEPNTCTDTDGGNFPLVKGTISGIKDGSSYSGNDYCMKSDLLVEYSCRGNEYFYEFHPFAGTNYECVDGVKVEKAAPCPYENSDITTCELLASIYSDFKQQTGIDRLCSLTDVVGFAVALNNNYPEEAARSVDNADHCSVCGDGTCEGYEENGYEGYGVCEQDCASQTHPADTNRDSVISTTELITYAQKWIDGQISRPELADAIDLWMVN